MVEEEQNDEEKKKIINFYDEEFLQQQFCIFFPLFASHSLYEIKSPVVF